MSVMKIAFLAFFLSGSYAVKVNPLKLQSTGSEELALMDLVLQKPADQGDLDANEATGLRSSLESKIKDMATDRKPTLFFIGDSLIRNQAMAACAIIKGTKKLTEACGNICNKPMNGAKCAGKNATLVYAWADDFVPQKVEFLAKEFDLQPDVIYFDAGFHGAAWDYVKHRDEEVQLTEYDHKAYQTLQAYHKDAPAAKIKAMLSHKPCHEQTHINHRQNAIRGPYPQPSQIKSRNDKLFYQAKKMASESVKVVDGYEFTENLGCSETVDGLHYDKHLFQELMEMLKA